MMALSEGEGVVAVSLAVSLQVHKLRALSSESEELDASYDADSVLAFPALCCSCLPSFALF